MGESVGDENGVGRDVAGVRDRDGPRPATNLHRSGDCQRGRIDDRDGAFGMISDIEKGAVGGQGATPRLGAYLDLVDYPALR